MNLLLAILAFNIIVIVHELGHFLIAKKMGIKVLEFSLFIGPKIFSIDRGDTTYSLRLFPIMAYVKMEGEDEESDSEDSFNKKSKRVRAATILGGPVANILLALVLLTAVFAIEGYSSTEIGNVYENSTAAQIGMLKGDRVISYNGKRTFLPIDVVQFLYVSKGETAQVEYERDGERFTGELTPVIHPEAKEPKLGISLSSEDPVNSNIVMALSPDMPAQEMGILVGDRIVALNGIEIDNADELIAYVNKNGMNPIKVKALRGESEVNVTIMPKEVKTEEWYDIGLAFSTKKGGILESLWQSLVFTVSIVRSVAYSLVWLITGQAKLSELMGPIGMVSTISTSVAMAPNLAQMLLYLMNITAYLSIAVGATNLIPFPMLDGGKLVLIGVEAVRGKPISPEKEGYISLVGFALIILLGIFAAYNDIVRIITG
ncbi:MAG: RIP metalloprotease RseP [Clostridiaceae bacterium]|jgi:regulator of sigma E protease|nr:RIP metalloprotease RseP [Clostridiaceae bacterium]